MTSPVLKTNRFKFRSAVDPRVFTFDFLARRNALYTL